MLSYGYFSWISMANIEMLNSNISISNIVVVVILLMYNKFRRLRCRLGKCAFIQYLVHVQQPNSAALCSFSQSHTSILSRWAVGNGCLQKETFLSLFILK